MEEEPEIGMRREGGGIGPVNRQEGGGPYGVVLPEEHVDHSSEPTMQDLSEALVAAAERTTGRTARLGSPGSRTCPVKP